MAITSSSVWNIFWFYNIQEANELSPAQNLWWEARSCSPAKSFILCGIVVSTIFVLLRVYIGWYFCWDGIVSDHGSAILPQELFIFIVKYILKFYGWWSDYNAFKSVLLGEKTLQLSCELSVDIFLPITFLMDKWGKSMTKNPGFLWYLLHFTVSIPGMKNKMFSLSICVTYSNAVMQLHLAKWGLSSCVANYIQYYSIN